METNNKKTKEIYKERLVEDDIMAEQHLRESDKEVKKMENKLTLEDYRKLAINAGSNKALRDIVRKKRLQLLEKKEEVMESKP